MKFVSPDGKDIHISLTSGHAAIVSKDPVELPPMFHREAIALGAVPSNMSKAAREAGKEAGKPTFDRKAVIRKTLEDMIAEGNEEDFTGNGIPKLPAVRTRAGFGVDKEEMTAIWEELTAELDSDDDNTEEGNG